MNLSQSYCARYLDPRDARGRVLAVLGILIYLHISSGALRASERVPRGDFRWSNYRRS